MIRVLLCDDHPVVREGVRGALEDAGDFDVVGEAGSVRECLARAEALRPDVVLLDLELPDGSGADAIGRLAAVAPGAAVLVFTAYDGDERVLGAVRAGARGYVLKGAPRDELARALRAVAAGGSHLTGPAAARVTAALRTPGRGVELTPRERDVLRLVARGASNKDIGAALGITERTAKFHVSALLTKLGASNRAQAVATAIARGIL